MTYLGTPVRPRLGIDFAPTPVSGAKGRDRRCCDSRAASTTGAAEGRVQAARLANKKHPRRVGPGA